MGRCRLSLLKGADDLSGESRCVVREANSPWEDPRVATQPEAGPIGSPSLWRWLLLFVAAMAPLIAVAALRGPLDLPNAVVGAGVLLSLLLAAAVTATDLLASRPVGNRRYLSFVERGEATEPKPATERNVMSISDSVSYDPLTGLPTFQPFSRRLLEEFHRVKESGELLALVLVDINHLARINEQFGVEVGDQVLRHVTACLQLSKRMKDILARMGDDEFGLLLPDCDGPGAYAFVERLNERLSRDSIKVRVGDWSTSLWIGICAGVAICDPTTPDADELLTTAVDDLNAAREERDRRRQRWKQSA